MSKENKEVVYDDSKLEAYDLKQGVSAKGKFTKKDATTIRKAVKVYPSFAGKHNDNFAKSGSFYELNKSANKDLQDAYAEAKKAEKKK